MKKAFSRGARAGLYAAALLTVFEYVVTLAVAQGPIRFFTALRFLALDATLVLCGCAVLVPVCGLLFVVARLLRRGDAPPRAAADEDSPAVAWLWGLFLCGSAYAAASVGLTLVFMQKFKEKFLIAGSLAALQLLLFAALAPLALLLARGFRRLAVAARRLGAMNPFARWLPAFAALALLVAGPIALLLKQMPQLRDVMPWRLMFAGAVLAYGVARGARRVDRRGTLLANRAWRRGIAAAMAVVAPVTLVWWGAHPETKYLAVTASPTLSRLVDFVRWANDFDRDGYGSLLGENDCAPFNPNIHPNAVDIPDNGIDENCNGKDFSLKTPPSVRRGERMPVPSEYRRDWNILLITIDALRYDHTGIGGYKAKKGRDTTPNLDQLAARSVVFDFANAPSAGTMASVPAIVTSKFFHSGIAVGPERRPMPPKILPENLMLAEVMKRGKYATGAILTHEYFNDWGLEQGFDTYDNSLGAKPNPMSITSQDVTSKAEAWIAQRGDDKWFLWLHYLDPHGRYVAHPGDVSYGTSEEDLYDGEISYADKYLGKLLEFLARTPAGQKTVIVVTSDHGDGFMEHGFINHGMALYRELLHVPLLIYVPELPPRRVAGVVSGLDAFPTIADLGGIDISDAAIEGQSLVPQLFYGKDDADRVVFAETNYPEPMRAAITATHKLIYNLKTNVYQLFDLKADPWEKRNLWGADKAGDQLKAALDEWLDRVFYSRDPLSQAQRVRMEQFLLPKRPAPAVATEGTAAGAVRVLGYDAKVPAAAGKQLDVAVYFEAVAATTQNLRAELDLAPPSEPGLSPSNVVYFRYPAGEGMFPSSKWRPGDFLRETYPLRVPLAWAGKKANLSLRFFDEKRAPIAVSGGRVTADGKGIVLGEIEVGPGAP